MTVETEAANAQLTLEMAAQSVSGALAVEPLALTQEAPEPCVNCEQEAAPRWLLCLDCVAKLDEAMLMRLTTKFVQLGEWLVQAEEALRFMPHGHLDFIAGWEVWNTKHRVYQRLGWLGQAVKGAA